MYTQNIKFACLYQLIRGAFSFSLSPGILQCTVMSFQSVFTSSTSVWITLCISFSFLAQLLFVQQAFECFLPFLFLQTLFYLLCSTIKLQFNLSYACLHNASLENNLCTQLFFNSRKRKSFEYFNSFWLNIRFKFSTFLFFYRELKEKKSSERQ